MCGRFYIDADAEFLLRYFKIKYKPVFEIDQRVVYPTQRSPVVIDVSDEKRIGPMTWGFNLPGSNKPIINARSESIHEKVLFKESFMKRRCLIPASGFYEWSMYDNIKPKAQYDIAAIDEPLICMAGIYRKQIDDNGAVKWVFTVITREADDAMKKIHPRMPLLIKPNDFDLWLGGDTDLQTVRKLLTCEPLKLDIEPYQQRLDT